MGYRSSGLFGTCSTSLLSLASSDALLLSSTASPKGAMSTPAMSQYMIQSMPASESFVFSGFRDSGLVVRSMPAFTVVARVQGYWSLFLGNFWHFASFDLI